MGELDLERLKRIREAVVHGLHERALVLPIADFDAILAMSG